MNIRTAIIAPAILILSSTCFAEQKMPSLNDTYKMTLGDVLSIEMSSTLQILSAKSDVFGMILTSYNRESERLQIQVYGKSNRSTSSIEKSKGKIEAIKQILEKFLIPRANERHGTTLSENDFVISILDGGKPVLIFEDGKYILSE